MQELKNVKASIDYPQEDEVITSEHYTFRIKAPLNAEKVEVCIDGSPWQLCRYSSGFWWYDWAGFATGEYEIVARILPFDSKNYTLRTRRFNVDLKTARRGAERSTLRQYSVVTNSEPWTLANVTQLLSREDVNIQGMMSMNVGDTASIHFLTENGHDLRRKLEAAGLQVVENEVFHLSIPNRPEELNKLCRSLAEKAVSIRSMYGTVDGDRCKIMLAVDQPHSAAPVVAEMSCVGPAS